MIEWNFGSNFSFGRRLDGFASPNQWLPMERKLARMFRPDAEPEMVFELALYGAFHEVGIEWI